MGNQLKSLREKNGLTLKELSARLETEKNYVVSDGQLSLYENGKRSPRNEDFWNIVADFYDVPVSYLRDGEQNKFNPFSLFKQGLKNLSASIDFKDETPQEYNLDWMNEAENEYKNLGLEGTLIDLEDFYTFYAMELKEPLKDLLVNFAKSPKENQDAVLSLLKTTAQNQNN
ncbi:helix-turn-helix domain-containing protein [Streptococcus agalactiae]|nr:helix-turn-helix transcriptional regulator [Streptococcus agalactiae]MBR3054217.1 helix-turn-helix transcriptional regulator [Streptococcus sp.]QBX07601.1 hypothetical protein JavanS16_0002 [Streptococcus satellite phage Javan16]AKI57044.1 Hypothetical Protein GBS85147_0615 [Streptococcus agalactiae]ASI65615.1 hypothetical protein GT95_03080 [Streptococcus agalactiae]EPT97321.1 hypothetical protein SAG0109_02490 [Streptococcus agalactiae BSU108]